MACTSCDHTMQQVNNGYPSVFWCQRCGTIKSQGEVPEFTEPTVLERSREFYQICELIIGPPLEVITQHGPNDHPPTHDEVWSVGTNLLECLRKESD